MFLVNKVSHSSSNAFLDLGSTARLVVLSFLNFHRYPLHIIPPANQLYGQVVVDIRHYREMFTPLQPRFSRRVKFPTRFFRLNYFNCNKCFFEWKFQPKHKDDNRDNFDTSNGIWPVNMEWARFRWIKDIRYYRENVHLLKSRFSRSDKFPTRFFGLNSFICNKCLF